MHQHRFSLIVGMMCNSDSGYADFKCDSGQKLITGNARGSLNPDTLFLRQFRNVDLPGCHLDAPRFRYFDDKMRVTDEHR